MQSAVINPLTMTKKAGMKDFILAKDEFILKLTEHKEKLYSDFGIQDANTCHVKGEGVLTVIQMISIKKFIM